MERLTATPSTPTTRVLLEALGRPDDPRARAAVAELVRRYGPFVYAVTLRYCRHDRALADDAYQTAFLRFFEAWRTHRFADPIRSFPALLARLARNAAVDLVRSAGARALASDTPVDPQASVVTDVERRMTLAALIEDLPDRDQAVLRESIVLGRTSEEAALVLGISPEAVRQRRTRAMARLRELLEVEERRWEQLDGTTGGARHT